MGLRSTRRSKIACDLNGFTARAASKETAAESRLASSKTTLPNKLMMIK